MRQPRDMHIHSILAAHVAAHLAKSFQERQAFNITYRPAHFHQHNFCAGSFRYQPNPAFDFIGNMGNHLNRPAQIIAAAFLADHLSVNLSGGHVAYPVQADVNKTLIMSQVQVRFSAIIQHIHFTMLVRAHRAGVDIDIRIQLLHCNSIASFLQQQTQCSCCHPLPHGANHATRKKDIFRRHAILLTIHSALSWFVASRA